VYMGNVLWYIWFLILLLYKWAEFSDMLSMVSSLIHWKCLFSKTFNWKMSKNNLSGFIWTLSQSSICSTQSMDVYASFTSLQHIKTCADPSTNPTNQDKGQWPMGKAKCRCGLGMFKVNRLRHSCRNVMKLENYGPQGMFNV
jgi:hypothetical protein